MRLNGWARIVIVLSLGWAAGIAVSAYLEYPKTLQDKSAYWHSYENPFDAYDPPHVRNQARDPGLFDDVLPPARIDPNIESFLMRGLAPIALLWALFGSIIWISRGFKHKADGAGTNAEATPRQDAAAALSSPESDQSQAKLHSAEAEAPSPKLPIKRDLSWAATIACFVGFYLVMFMNPVQGSGGNVLLFPLASLGLVTVISLVIVVPFQIFRKGEERARFRRNLVMTVGILSALQAWNWVAS